MEFTANHKFLVVSLHSNESKPDEDYHKQLLELKSEIGSLETFYDPQCCFDFLDQIKDKRILLIVSDTLGQHFLPVVHENPQVELIFVLCINRSCDSNWTKDLSKLEGVFTRTSLICERVRRAVRKYGAHVEPISTVPFVNSSEDLVHNDNESFMYTQLLKEVLINMNYGRDAITELAKYCYDQCRGHINSAELNVIRDLPSTYEDHSPIWWYTRDCFIYYILNRALRSHDFVALIKMGVFMRDLHEQITELHSISDINESFIVYRGQGMLDDEFKNLHEHKLGLLCFNSFLSTSREQQVSLNFARQARDDDGMLGILFCMTIDVKIRTVPYATVGSLGYYEHEEEEIIFSMHTVFRVCAIEQIDNRLWRIDLELVEDNDRQLQIMTNKIRYDIRGTTEKHRLGNLMIHLRQYDNAEKLYRMLLDSTTSYDHVEIAQLCSRLAYIMECKGDNRNAIVFYERTLEMDKRLYANADLRLAGTYHSIGILKTNIKDYLGALDYFQIAVEIGERSPEPNKASKLKAWRDNLDFVRKRLNHQLSSEEVSCDA